MAMVLTPQAAPAAAGAGTTSSPRGEAGMSLIEVLIALVLIGVVAIGIVPLFARSVRQNREGGNYTDITNVARSCLEEYLQFEFNAPSLTVPAGSTERMTNQYLDPGTKRWVTYVSPTVPPANALYQRSVQVQQFTAGDLVLDGSLDSPQDGGVPARNIQLKLVRVAVRPLWGGVGGGSGGGVFDILGKRTPIAIEVLKAV